MRNDATIGGVSLADVRTFMIAVERRPALLNSHQDVREWIVRMSSALTTRSEQQQRERAVSALHQPPTQPQPHAKRARAQLNEDAAQAALMSAPPPVQSRIPVPQRATPSSLLAPQPRAGDASMPAAAAISKPLPLLAAGGAAAAAAALGGTRAPATPSAPPPATPTAAGTVAPSPAFSFAAPPTERCARATPSQPVGERVPLGLSPMLNFAQALAELPPAMMIATASAKKRTLADTPPATPAAVAAAADGAAPVAPTPTDGGGEGAATESVLDVTPSLASPPKSTRRLRPRLRDGASPSLSTPSFSASPPNTTRRLQPPRSSARPSLLGVGGTSALRYGCGLDDTPSLPATPCLEASPLKSIKCKRQERGSLGWSDASSPPQMPTFEASPPRTVRPAANPAGRLAPPSDARASKPLSARAERARAADFETELERRGGVYGFDGGGGGPSGSRSPPPGDLLLDFAQDDFECGEVTTQLGVLQGGCMADALATNGVRTEGFALRPPCELPGQSPARQPAADAAEPRAAADGQAAAGAAALPPKLPELDLERFPSMFRAAHSDGAQRLREVYAVLRARDGPLSATDVAGALPAGKYGSQIVAFLLDLLTTRAYLYTQLDGDLKCWRAV
jgi:hypothetical protein